jgi:hypothetical protein
MMTNPKRTLTSRRMQLIFSLVLIAAAAVGLARMVCAASGTHAANISRAVNIATALRPSID